MFWLFFYLKFINEPNLDKIGMSQRKKNGNVY